MPKPEHLTIAAQGDRFSYHGEAARLIADDPDVNIMGFDEFGDVVRASRSYVPGLGVIAIRTAIGMVEKSAEQVIEQHVSALPPIVARVDVPVSLALIGSTAQRLEDLNRHGVHCLVQKEARIQCRAFLEKHLNWVNLEPRAESTRAVMDAVESYSRDVVAIGPPTAAEPLGGIILAEHINPPDSVTSFYVLQRNPTEKRLPYDNAKTEARTVISLTLPDEAGAFDKTLRLIKTLGINVMRFMPFDRHRLSRRHDGSAWYGGLLEVHGDVYDEGVTELCARINKQKTAHGRPHQFETQKLGGYGWHMENPLDLQTLLDEHATSS